MMSLLQNKYPDGVLPKPPYIGQNVAQLPDGTLDPFHGNDCGETCVASILQVATGYYISPGCVRQALGHPESLGLTFSGELKSFLVAMGLNADTMFTPYEAAWKELQRLRHHGRYALILGRWIGPSWLHWYLAYERGETNVLVMDPWTGGTVARSAEKFRALYADAAVFVS